MQLERLGMKHDGREVPAYVEICCVLSDLNVHIRYKTHSAKASMEMDTQGVFCYERGGDTTPSDEYPNFQFLLSVSLLT